MDDLTPINWQAYEYHYVPKSADWFWAVGIIAVCTAIVAVIFGDLLFAVVVIIGTFGLFLYAVREPRLINFEVNHRGLIINDRLYPYITLDSFWVEEFNVHPQPKLLIKSQKVIMPLISIIIEDVDHEEVRQFLLNYLPEEEHTEPLSQKIMEYLGF